jgi:hypothetical protein
MLADFFMRIHDVSTSIAAGIFKDQVIVIFRTIGRRRNAGKLASEAFSLVGRPEAQGHGPGGNPLTNLDQKLLKRQRPGAVLWRRIAKQAPRPPLRPSQRTRGAAGLPPETGFENPPIAAGRFGYFRYNPDLAATGS